MNAPTAPSLLIPAVSQREVPAEMLAALQARFGAQYSAALAVREQHGRDESAYTHVPPPAAVVFAVLLRGEQAATAGAAQRIWLQAIHSRNWCPFLCVCGAVVVLALPVRLARPAVLGRASI